MNKRTSICLTTLQNQIFQQKAKNSSIKEMPRGLESDEDLQNNKHLEENQKNSINLISSQYSNSLSKVEISTNDSPSSLRVTVRKIQEYYQQQESIQNQGSNKYVVPEFIRQRDQQKKDMQLQIKENQQTFDGKINQNVAQYYFIELLLIILIVIMWIQIYHYVFQIDY